MTPIAKQMIHWCMALVAVHIFTMLPAYLLFAGETPWHQAYGLTSLVIGLFFSIQTLRAYERVWGNDFTGYIRDDR